MCCAPWLIFQCLMSRYSSGIICWCCIDIGASIALAYGQVLHWHMSWYGIGICACIVLVYEKYCIFIWTGIALAYELVLKWQMG